MNFHLCLDSVQPLVLAVRLGIFKPFIVFWNNKKET